MIQKYSVPEESSIDYQYINNEYISKNKPVILKNFAKDWQALQRWTPEFLRENYGSVNVKTFDKKFILPGKYYLKSSGSMSFRDYLDLIFSNPSNLRLFLFKLYDQAPELQKDIIFPDGFEHLSRKFVFLFFGGKGSEPPNHYDVDMPHVFHTVLHGKKRVVLFDPNQSKNLYQHPLTVRTYVDTDDPDYTRFPKLKNVNANECILNKGDTLFIPSGYWHRIVYLEASYAISIRQYKRNIFSIANGVYNLFIRENIDKLLNKLFPDLWFDWKSRYVEKH